MAQGTTGRLAPIVHDDVERVEGRDARGTNFAAGRVLGETVRTTLGPKGLDKMLVSAEGKIVVTNDGASILDRMDIEHPAAEMIAEVAQDQDQRTGDGTTTVVVLAGELLAEAEALIERGFHQTTITRGYRLAAQRALDRLQLYSTRIDPHDTDRLEAIAGTVITGKWDTDAVEFLSGLAVEAVLAIERAGTVDRRRITPKPFPGSDLRDSAVVDGLVIDLNESSTDIVTPGTERPRRIDDARIALIDDQLTIETIDGLGTVALESAQERQQLLEYEDDVYAAQVETIANAGADVVVCQKSIDDAVRYLLAKKGILAVERTRRDEFIQLARATGATHVGAVGELTAADTGRAGTIERRTVGNRELAIVRDCAGTEQVSVVLRGGPRHVVDELDRIMEDCFGVLKLAIEQGTVLPGGGAIETQLACDLRAYAREVGTREGLVIEAFADALEVVPRTLAATAGFDPLDALADLRGHHHDGDVAAGLDLTTGTVVDMIEAGVLEPLAVKQRAISGAEEAANMLIRVDDVIAASRDRTQDDHGHGHDHDHDDGHGGIHSTGGYPWAIGH